MELLAIVLLIVVVVVLMNFWKSCGCIALFIGMFLLAGGCAVLLNASSSPNANPITGLIALVIGIIIILVAKKLMED